ncbi:ABC transporter ATP-binding protein [Clostridium sp. Mt-5]|uniref:ABC transporter ATP-binding protein n=1 Tax=Clostridium moutaii TaxID=3240932 RepID=A0ABV4BWX3_9CLOT
MDESIILIKGLVKRYGSFTAVNGLDIEVKKGEVFGILGPNGAGKTTTLECLEGIRKSDGGKIRVAGCDPEADERKLRNKLGVQLQSSSLPDSILVGEAISLIGAWHGLSECSKLIKKFRIENLLKKQYGKLSTGQKRHLHLALALINNPDVVVLDEPTAGLDVQSRAQLHEEILSIKSQGITVLLATHDMAEVEKLCDRIAIIIHGRLAVCGTTEQVKSAGNKQTSIRLRTNKGSLLPGTNIGEAKFIKTKEGYLEWKSEDIESSILEMLKKVKDAGDTIEDLRVERPTIEERFLELVEGVEN